MAALGKGNVVRDYYIGNTRILICDDYCRNQTHEEREAIRRRASRIALEALSAQAAATVSCENLI